MKMWGGSAELSSGIYKREQGFLVKIVSSMLDL